MATDTALAKLTALRQHFDRAVTAAAMADGFKSWFEDNNLNAAVYRSCSQSVQEVITILGRDGQAKAARLLTTVIADFQRRAEGYEKDSRSLLSSFLGADRRKAAEFKTCARQATQALQLIG